MSDKTPTPPAPRTEAPAPAPVGHPGNLWTHLAELSAALRARDWSRAFELTMEILGFLKRDFETVAPTAMGAVGAGVGSAATADQLADAIDATVKRRDAGTLGPMTATAIPWATLIPLILQILQAVLRRQ